MIDNTLLDQDDTSSEELQQALAFDDDQDGRFMQKNFLRACHGISVASAVILTTVTDVIGFLIVLGLGSLILI